MPREGPEKRFLSTSGTVGVLPRSRERTHGSGRARGPSCPGYARGPTDPVARPEGDLKEGRVACPCPAARVSARRPVDCGTHG